MSFLAGKKCIFGSVILPKRELILWVKLKYSGSVPAFGVGQKDSGSTVENGTAVNPYQTGLFGLSKDRGGVESALLDFLSFYVLIFYPNQLNMVSNESWHLFPTIESLKTILCSVDFWYGGAEVT